MKSTSFTLSLLPLLLLSACATVPTAPSVMALPGTGKVFDQFMVDDAACREFASRQIGAGGEGEEVVRSAAIATVIGAVAGAVIGGRDGAAVGAGIGLVAGSAAGSEQARASGRGTQRQYDQAYVQCMYARGHKVPVQGGMMESRPDSGANPASPAMAPPPPPPGPPPPPPPGR